MSQLGQLLAESTGYTTAKFEKPGDLVRGPVVAVAVRQVRDFQSGTPETWDDGNPKQQVVISVQTDLREDGDDDGIRSIYIKWWGQPKQAFQDALRAAKAKDIDTGGQFAAQYTGDGEKPRAGFSAPKLFAFEYRPPTGVAGLISEAQPAAQQGFQQAAPADPWANQSPASQAFTQQAGPTVQQAVTAPPVQQAPAAPAVDLQKLIGLIRGGFDDAGIASFMPDVTPEQIAAARNAAGA